MTQNRKPPAYQEYATSMLSDRAFRMMSLEERGLLYTMRLECWVNGALPDHPGALAKTLGLDVVAVESSLPVVMCHFAIQNGVIFSPELEDYRTHLKEAREKMKEGGKRGADKTNAKANSKKQKGVSATPPATPSG